LSLAGLLIALGTTIPMFSPLKVIIEPASFTLGSHVAIFLAMFISPPVAVAVALGTTIGFFISGFPFIVVMRAGTHIIFAFLGSWYVTRRRNAGLSPVQLRIFSFTVALIHALSEIAVVSIFYFGGNSDMVFNASEFVTAVLLLVGIGTLIHSLVDFEITLLLLKPLRKLRLID